MWSPWEMSKTESENKLSIPSSAVIEESIHDIKVMISEVKHIIFKQKI